MMISTSPLPAAPVAAACHGPATTRRGALLPARAAASPGVEWPAAPLLERRSLLAGSMPAARRRPSTTVRPSVACDASTKIRAPVGEVPKNLVLIGGRGCGKSSICRRIQASDKRLKLFSLDDVIVYEADGRSIPQIVEDEGWPAFRDIEYETCRKVGDIPGWALVDCGGGVVVDLDEEGNEVYSERKVDALKKHGVVVYIKRDVDYLIGRIAGDSNRPDLSATASFREIMARREPWYMEAADLVIDCKAKKKKVQIARQILEFFHEETGTEPVGGKWYNVFEAKR